MDSSQETALPVAEKEKPSRAVLGRVWWGDPFLAELRSWPVLASCAVGPPLCLSCPGEWMQLAQSADWPLQPVMLLFPRPAIIFLLLGLHHNILQSNG